MFFAVLVFVVLISVKQVFLSDFMPNIVADKILFAEGNETEMYRTANELNSESVTGWHTIVLKDSGSIYMYRQCLWISESLTSSELTDILCDCITEYKIGRSRFAPHEAS